jgi:polyisoprenoid-binding protein YceI
MYTDTITENKTIWALDAAHSELSFKVKHLMISTVTGYFDSFRVTAETEGDDFSKILSINAEADVSSIDTKNEPRDAHLRSEDFFDAEKFSLITFKATGFDAGSTGELEDHLTIKGRTRPITLQVEKGGMVIDPYGHTKAGFTITGKISRKDFGITRNATTETGSVVVGDEVKINAEIQLIKQV